VKYQPGALEVATLWELRDAVHRELERVERALSELEPDSMLLGPSRTEPRRSVGLVVRVASAATWSGQAVTPGLWMWTGATWKEL
jgi:hypothetical protein